MSKPELVLSNTTSFFSGRIETVFQNAKKYGFKYLEIIPYRWTTPEQIFGLEKKYGVEVAGIHLPVWWKKSALDHIRAQKNILEKFFTCLWAFYLGPASRSPGLPLAQAFHEQGRDPYLLSHSNVVNEMGNEFADIAARFHVVIENIPFQSHQPQFFWDPLTIKVSTARYGINAGLVFDHGHFNQTRQKIPNLDLPDIYQKAVPEIIHISYNRNFFHTLPNLQEQEELKQLLTIHAPRYVVIETNPLINIQKAKLLINSILDQVFA